jgi:hypothetical protein
MMVLLAVPCCSGEPPPRRRRRTSAREQKRNKPRPTGPHWTNQTHRYRAQNATARAQQHGSELWSPVRDEEAAGSNPVTPTSVSAGGVPRDGGEPLTRQPGRLPRPGPAPAWQPRSPAPPKEAREIHTGAPLGKHSVARPLTHLEGGTAATRTDGWGDTKATVEVDASSSRSRATAPACTSCTTARCRARDVNDRDAPIPSRRPQGRRSVEVARGATSGFRLPTPRWSAAQPRPGWPPLRPVPRRSSSRAGAPWEVCAWVITIPPARHAKGLCGAF